MVAFIDDHRAEYGVEPICAVLPIAPSTYYVHKAWEADPSLRSARAQRDEILCGEISRVWEENFQVYGAKKAWKQLNREGIAVARCTVARLMREMDLRGVVRGRSFKTLSANVRETRSTQRIRVGRRQRKRTCWDCEREWKRMVVPLEPGRPSEARQLLRTRR